MSTIAAQRISNLAGTASTSMDDAINGSAKAWVNFNGTGTVAIRASYNVSSITDNAVGDYMVNFTNAMQDTNYAVTGTTGSVGAIVGVITYDHATARSTTMFRILTFNSSFVGADAPYNHLAIFR